MAKAIFTVGPAHPIYGKVVEAEIINTNCGFDGRQIYGRTVNPVHYPENPKGIFIEDEFGNCIGYKPKPAHDAVWEGYIEKVIEG